MTKQKKTEIVTEQVSEQDVWDILTYAASLGYNNAILTPMLVNQRMKDINLNPVAATENDLNQALADPKNSELQLYEFSQSFELTSQIYKKLLSYMSNILSFDMTYECINADVSDYKSKAYKKDLDIFKKFIDNFNYKEIFSGVVSELFRSEAAFYCPREDGDRLVLQELPSSPTYTMLTGRWVNGLTFSFNMMHFLLPGVDLKMYPKFFSEKFRTLWGEGKNKEYIPSLPPELRGKSEWIYWVDVPVNVGWVFKLNQGIPSRIPHFAPMFLDLIQQPLIRALQKNINMSVAKRMILGAVGTLKDAQSKVKDQFAINPDTLGKFLAVVQAAIGDSLKVAAAPLDGLQGISFPSENEVYSSYLQTALATSGISTDLIFTSSVKRDAISTQLAVNVEEDLLYGIYPQFENFMNYFINKRTSKYKFKVHFEGSQFFNNRAQRFERAMTLADKGIVLPNLISSSIGMNPFEFQRNLEEAQSNDWVSKLTPIISAFQMSGDSKKGRPSKSDSELSDSGAQTRSDASNVSRGGKK